MTVRAEVWPVAADPAGLWLLSGTDAWRNSGPIMADSSLHWEVELLLHYGGDPGERPDRLGPLVYMDEVAVLHSTGGTAPGAEWTSWRPDLGYVIHTYMAAVNLDGFARERFPLAEPVTLDLFRAAGLPPTHGAAEEPLPRWLDVLWHGLGHLHWLYNHNGENRAALGPLWGQKLEPFEEALATLYERRHVPAA